MDEKLKKRVNSYSSFSKSSNIEKEKVQRKVTMPTSSNLIEKYSIKDEVSEENENSSSSSSYSYPNGYTPANLKNKIDQARTAINGGTIIRMEPIQSLPGLGLTVTETALRNAIILMLTDG